MKKTFPTPNPILELIRDGIWPETKEESLRQNLQPLLSKAAIQSFAPDESSLYLYASPFCTIQNEKDNFESFDDDWNALGEINPDRALVIADFGAGSDTCIILDYRDEPPKMLRLKYSEEGNHWIPLGLTPKEFSDLIRKNHAEQGESGQLRSLRSLRATS